jgi:hypothetical protein
LGTVSVRIFLSFPLLLMIMVYGITFWAGKGFLATSGQTNRVEKSFIVLSIASLAYRGIYNIFNQVFSFQIPTLNVVKNYGIAGYMIEILVGIVILMVILGGMNRWFPKPLENEEE